MGLSRGLSRVAVLGLVTLITADASCTTICKFGGHNTSCNERIMWVRSHVDTWDRVVMKGPAEDKTLTCEQSRDKVIHDCPICKQCSVQEACTFHQGDLVSVRYWDKKLHPGRITKVLAKEKYEVTMTDIPVVIPSTHDVQKPVAVPHPVRTAAISAGAPMPSTTGLIAAKFSSMSKIFGTNDSRPHFFVGAVIGGVGIVGLSAMVVRKLRERRQNSGRLVEVQE